ncbi:MAG: adenosylcobinamide-GDP ribazoletransferase [Desulfobulbaceae bacterium]|nr:MAG: adenosylcobinamide-GDP ribazoletransferase [Desulfobulbaceae bacterium]
MKTHLQGLRTAITFLTIIPLPKWQQGISEDFLGSVKYFPLVGMLTGFIIMVTGMISTSIFPQTVSIVLLVFLLSLISGFFHLDGLADTADGFLSSKPKQAILEIMKDSRIGVMGACTIIFLLLFKISALFSVSGDDLSFVLFCGPYFGRIAIVAMMGSMVYARKKNDGLAGLFSNFRSSALSLVHIIILGCVCFAAMGVAGLLCLFFSSFTIGAFFYLSYRKIGGYTGDTLGAACELGEAAFFISCATFL